MDREWCSIGAQAGHRNAKAASSRQRLSQYLQLVDSARALTMCLEKVVESGYFDHDGKSKLLSAPAALRHRCAS
jgi:hypothetical protein